MSAKLTKKLDNRRAGYAATVPPRGAQEAAPAARLGLPSAPDMHNLDLTSRIEASYRTAGPEAISSAVLALGLLASLAGHAPSGRLAAFAATALIVFTGRYLIARRFLRTSAADSARWTKIHAVGAAFTGAVWGLGGVLFVGPVTLVPTGVTLYWIGMALVAGMLLNATSFTAVVVFTLAAILPTVLALAAAPATAPELLAAAAMIAGLGIATLTVGRLVARERVQALAHQGNIRYLTSLLDQRREQVEKLNVAAKTNADKRQQAEREVKKLSADLGLVQGKAKALSETLARVATSCNVTELSNRRHFDELLALEWRRSLREKQPLSLLVVAIDDYDDFLKTRGRQATDAMLKRIAKIVRSFGRRAGDEAARFAEDRLALLLPKADTRNAARIAETIRSRVEAKQIQHHSEGSRPFVTVHVGVVTMIPVAALEPGELVRRVETSLYEAQFRGGNRVVAFQALERLRLERWDQKSDGELNEQGMLQKMLVWGLEPARRIHDGRTTVLEEVTLNEEHVFGVLSGLMKLIVEGHEVQIKPGDALFLPAGVHCTAAVESDTPLMLLEATRPVEAREHGQR